MYELLTPTTSLAEDQAGLQGHNVWFTSYTVLDQGSEIGLSVPAERANHLSIPQMQTLIYRPLNS